MDPASKALSLLNGGVYTLLRQAGRAIEVPKSTLSDRRSGL